MPSIDMPLEQLRQYKPPLYRQGDFESFWESTTAEALKQPVNAELIPYDLRTKGTVCYAVALADGRAFALKADDGAPRVRSDAVDYPYAKREGAEMAMEAFELPPAVAESCLRASRALGLPLAGIDFKLTPDGDYVCFEVNPSPGFLFYEQYTGQPISAALADLLLAGRSSASPH